ncbi:MAG: hypothetical protein IIC10_00390 [Proteobacteria bacterium]|nr:hypothetical protein [Pseudomonadota bacterium]
MIYLLLYEPFAAHLQAGKAIDNNDTQTARLDAVYCSWVRESNAVLGLMQ